MDLNGKKILVTGGAGGIGLATAQVLSKQGADVAIADLDADRLEAAVATFGTTKVVPIVADVADAASVEAMVATAESGLGGLSGLFNNAGILDARDNEVTEAEEAVWDRVIDVNLKSMYLCCRFGIAALLRNGGGAVVNNASIVAALGSYPSQIAYTASKGGVLSMTRELGVAYARRGIRVNAVMPGVVRTSMGAQVMSRDSAENDRDRERLRHIPMGRYAEPAEIGNLVAFLLSDAASYVTAQGWCIDGGVTGAYLCPPAGEPS